MPDVSPKVHPFIQLQESHESMASPEDPFASGQMRHLRRHLRQDWLTNRFGHGGNCHWISRFAQSWGEDSPEEDPSAREHGFELEKEFQEEMTQTQLPSARLRLLGFAALLLIAAIVSHVWPDSIRYSWALRAIFSQPKSAHGEHALLNPACECTEDGMSGSVVVEEVGCSVHGAVGDANDWRYCYVVRPTECAEAAASVMYPGAGYLYCDDRPPSHLLALASTTRPSAFGAAIFLVTWMLLVLESLQRHWKNISSICCEHSHICPREAP